MTMSRTLSLVAAALLFMLFPVTSPGQVRQCRVKVVKEYPHDVTSYTQGLFFRDGQLYESTGQKGSSTFRKVDLETGKALRRLDFNERYFVEGSAVLGDNLYILTWMSRVAFIYDINTLGYKATLSYPRQGWGLTADGKSLIASDGSSRLYFLDRNLRVTGTVNVSGAEYGVTGAVDVDGGIVNVNDGATLNADNVTLTGASQVNVAGLLEVDAGKAGAVGPVGCLGRVLRKPRHAQGLRLAHCHG